MNCPYCQSCIFKKNGKFKNRVLNLVVQRFRCKSCGKTYSHRSFEPNYYQKKPYLNRELFFLLTKGQSQRACAYILGVRPNTVNSRVPYFGELSQKYLDYYWKIFQAPNDIIFDEAESFIHSKCKPVTIPIAVENKTRRVIAIDVGNIRGKGHLAEKAKKLYPEHKSEKKTTLERFFKNLSERVTPEPNLASDMSSHYAKYVKKYFKDANYVRYKGRRGCVVGQGELKAGGFDPLFSLNHTIAMFRDNLKRLTRKTWCTSKRSDRLLNMLNMYAVHHNLVIDQKIGNKLVPLQFLNN